MTDRSAPPASRKHPNASLTLGIAELDAVESLAIPQRKSLVPRAQGEVNVFSSTPTLAFDTDGDTTSSGAGDDSAHGAVVSRGARTTSRPVAKRRSPGEHSVWPQWAFALAVLGAALWYLFSVEPPSRAKRSIQTEQRALTPEQ